MVTVNIIRSCFLNCYACNYIKYNYLVKLEQTGYYKKICVSDQYLISPCNYVLWESSDGCNVTRIACIGAALF